MTARHRSLIELNLAVLLWAGTALFAKWIALPPFQITALRSVVAVLAVLVVLRAQGRSLTPGNRRDLGLLTAGGLCLAAHWVTYFQAIQVSTVAVGILALHTYPVITALLEPAWHRERLRLPDFLLALGVLAGVAVLVPSLSLDSQITRGVAFGVLSALCFAVRNLLTGGVVTRLGGAKVTLYQLVVSAVALLPAAWLWGEPLTLPASGQLLLLGVVFTALPHTLYTRSLGHLKATSVGIIATLLPIYGALSAALLLGEVPALRTVIGGAIILVAISIETWRVMRK
jgi:drug/metabolite transporter (DMT)-like permease